MPIPSVPFAAWMRFHRIETEIGTQAILLTGQEARCNSSGSHVFVVILPFGGFVAQISLKAIYPKPQTDLSHTHRRRRAQLREAI